MKFNQVFWEKDLEHHRAAIRIREKLKHLPQFPIDRYDDTWGQSKVPYLQKRQGLNVFIARKRGTLIKQTPPAYGESKGSHYYFMHAFNCPYECEYCYLQGHFHTPHLVIFVNHEEITRQMQLILDRHREQETGLPVYFHAGEFSDSLAMAHITDELSFYWPFFRANPDAILELRTKSANIAPLLALGPNPQVRSTFSLSGPHQIKSYEHGTAPLEARIQAIQKLFEKGHQVGLHFDPIVFHQSWRQDITTMLERLQSTGVLPHLSYVSLGVVRFPENVEKEFRRNYPQSELLPKALQTTSAGMKRYPYPLRYRFLKELKTMCIQAGIAPSSIYFCMEELAQ